MKFVETKKGKRNKLEQSEKGMGERGICRKGKMRNKDREIIGQHEGGGWQRGKEAPHLACPLGPATWGSGPG